MRDQRGFLDQTVAFAAVGGIGLSQVLAVISGKGGTGKTTLCAGVALCLAEAGQKVLCIDADVGLRNLDISLGLSEEPALCFTDIMRGEYPLSRATVHPRCSNLHFLTAPVTETPEALDPELFGDLLRQVREEYDWCLIDAPAGVGAGFRLAVRWADLAMVVSNSDPASLRDGAKAAQMLEYFSKAEPKLVVNRIRRRFFRKTRFTVDDCMDSVGLPLLGIVPEDETVSLSAARGQVLLDSADKKGAAAACRHIARRLLGEKQPLLNL